MRAIKGKLAALFLVILFLLQANPAGAAERRAILVLLDRASWSDLRQDGLPHIRSILATGALGLMNTNTGGTRTPENTSASIGAGRVSTAGKAEVYAGGDAVAVEAFFRNTGYRAPVGALVIPNWPAIRAANDAAGGGRLGALGEALRQAGMNVALFGNSDILETRRYGALLAADSQGIIPAGDVSDKTLARTIAGPLPQVTNYNALLQLLQRWRQGSGLLVVELGDLSRLEELAGQVDPVLWQEARREALARADGFLGRLAGSLYNEERLYLLSATPSARAQERKQLLTPLVVYGPGVAAGLLTSGSTRREGLVANSDLAPDILDYLGLEQPPEMVGRPMQALPLAGAVQRLTRLENRTAAVNLARPQLVRAYVLGQIALVAAAVAACVWLTGLVRWVRPAVVGLAAGPLAFLLLGALPPLQVSASFLAAALLALLLGGGAWLIARRDAMTALFLLACTSVLALAADVLAGAPLMQGSVLGYDPMGGARYYGLGNEYMGLLVGAAAVGGTGLAERLPGRRWLPLVLAAGYAGLVAVIGSSIWGANVGGVVAAVAGFGVAMTLLSGRRVNARSIAVLSGGVIVVLMLFAAVDLGRSAPVQSHLARALQNQAQHGGGALWEIAGRKLALNLKLIRYTIWSRVFLTMLAGAAVLAWRPPGLLRRLRQEYPSLTAGLAGSLAGSLAALAANDSGIVAAATGMIFGVGVLLLAGMEQERVEIMFDKPRDAD